ncbi:unnamed protein product, partial [Linum tenue]
VLQRLSFKLITTFLLGWQATIGSTGTSSDLIVIILRRITVNHADIKQDGANGEPDEEPAKEDVHQRFGSFQRLLPRAPNNFVPVFSVNHAPFRHQFRSPKHVPHDYEPPALAHYAYRPYVAHKETP